MRFSIAVTEPGETPRRSASAEFVTEPAVAFGERVDRLRVVLDRLGVRGGRVAAET